MRPRLILVRIHVLHRHLIVLIVEAHDFLSDTRSSTVRSFVAEVKYLLPCRASSIIHDALGQDTDHRTLARVDITNDGNSNIVRVTISCGHVVRCCLKLSRSLDLSYLTGLIRGHESHVRRRQTSNVVLFVAGSCRDLGLLFWVAALNCSCRVRVLSVLLDWCLLRLIFLRLCGIVLRGVVLRLGLYTFFGKCPSLIWEAEMFLLDALEHLVETLLLHASAACSAASPAASGGTWWATSSTTTSTSCWRLLLFWLFWLFNCVRNIICRISFVWLCRFLITFDHYF